MSDLNTQARPSHVLADPSAKAVARVYAEAYLDAAASAGVESPMEEITSFVDNVLTAHPEFANLLTSEMTSRDDKRGIIDRVVRPLGSEFFINFILVLARHERLDLLPLILGEAWLEHEHRAGRRRVQIHSAAALSETQVNKIRDRLKAVLPYEPILVPHVDESLIGGLIIQVGDTVYDGSLRTRLRDLKHRLRERYLNEIQSGRNRFSHSEGN